MSVETFDTQVTNSQCLDIFGSFSETVSVTQGKQVIALQNTTSLLFRLVRWPGLDRVSLYALTIGLLTSIGPTVSSAQATDPSGVANWAPTHFSAPGGAGGSVGPALPGGNPSILGSSGNATGLNAFQQAALACFQGLLGPGGGPGVIGLDGNAIPMGQGLRDVADAMNDRAGNLPADQQSTYMNPESARRFGREVDARFGTGCHNFINRNGELGPWGRAALEEIRRWDQTPGFQGVFTRTNLADMTRNPQQILGTVNTPQGRRTPASTSGGLCPRFESFNPEQREQFWIWTLMSLASPESSCRPGAAGTGIGNGRTPMGLFQLDTDHDCGNINLQNPYDNIRCAVAKMAREVRERSDIVERRTGAPGNGMRTSMLQWPTSRAIHGEQSRRYGRANLHGATYWGPLRNDDHNAGRGGDTHGAAKFRAHMRANPQCTGDGQAPQGRAQSPPRSQ